MNVHFLLNVCSITTHQPEWCVGIFSKSSVTNTTLIDWINPIENLYLIENICHDARSSSPEQQNYTNSMKSEFDFFPRRWAISFGTANVWFHFLCCYISWKKVRNNNLWREKGILKTNKLNEPKMHFNNFQIKLEV